MAYFVFVVLIMAEFLMAKLEFIILQSLTKGSEWLFVFQHAVSDCRNVVPDNSTEGVHRIHSRGVHHEQYSLLTSTNMKCVAGGLKLS